MGEELRTVASLLGHADLATTMGYAHLAETPIAEAADRVADGMEAALIPAEPVTPIKPSPPRPPRPPRSKPVRRKPPVEENLSEKDRYWEAHVQAFHESPLRLDPFCAEHGLSRILMRRALKQHFERRKARLEVPS